MKPIALYGASGSGKNYVANILVDRYGYAEIAFADPIAAAVSALLPAYNWRSRKDVPLDDFGGKTPRDLMKMIGEGGRAMDEDVWVGKLLKSMGFRMNDLYPEPFVVTDLRRDNERAALEAEGFTFVHIVRPAHKSEADVDHPSEQEWVDWRGDDILYNDDDLLASLEVLING